MSDPWGLNVLSKIVVESEYCRRFRDLLDAFVATGDIHDDPYLRCLKIETIQALREYRERVDSVNQGLREGWENDSENDPVVVVDAAAE